MIVSSVYPKRFDKHDLAALSAFSDEMFYRGIEGKRNLHFLAPQIYKRTGGCLNIIEFFISYRFLKILYQENQDNLASNSEMEWSIARFGPRFKRKKTNLSKIFPHLRGVSKKDGCFGFFAVLNVDAHIQLGKLRRKFSKGDVLVLSVENILKCTISVIDGSEFTFCLGATLWNRVPRIAPWCFDL